MRHFGVAACQRLRHATFSRRCVPAGPSSDFLASLRASGPVKRLFGVAACQRPRQATFWRRCVPAGPVKRLFGVAACQRPRQASFWRRCVPAAPSSDFLAPLRASGAVKRLFGVAVCQRPRQLTCRRKRNRNPLNPAADHLPGHRRQRSIDNSPLRLYLCRLRINSRQTKWRL